MTDIPALADDAAELATFLNGLAGGMLYRGEITVDIAAKINAASTALRSLTTALEIGRAMQREADAKIADGWLEQFRDRKIDFVRSEQYASDAVADIRDAIRSTAHAVDLEGLTEQWARIIATADCSDDPAPHIAAIRQRISDLEWPRYANKVRVLLASLGLHAREN